jgi:hypothetical protein
VDVQVPLIWQVTIGAGFPFMETEGPGRVPASGCAVDTGLKYTVPVFGNVDDTAFAGTGVRGKLFKG